MNVIDTIINTTTTDMVVSLTWSGGAEESLKKNNNFPYDITIISILVYVEFLIFATYYKKNCYILTFYILVFILVDSYVTISRTPPSV